MNESDKKFAFLEAALEAAQGKDGNFEFTCPLCDGYAIGVYKSCFNSYRASCACCRFAAAGKLDARQSA